MGGRGVFVTPVTTCHYCNNLSYLSDLYDAIRPSRLSHNRLGEIPVREPEAEQVHQREVPENPAFPQRVLDVARFVASGTLGHKVQAFERTLQPVRWVNAQEQNTVIDAYSSPDRLWSSSDLLDFLGGGRPVVWGKDRRDKVHDAQQQFLHHDQSPVAC